MPFTLFIVIAFIIWFSSVWIAVLSLFSIVGGWNALSRLYPFHYSDKNNHTVKYPMSSIKLGLINYRACTIISFTKTGIIFEMFKIFTIMHKPIFIPYYKISEIERGKKFSTYTGFMVGEKKVIIYGKAADELFSRISSPDILS